MFRVVCVSVLIAVIRKVVSGELDLDGPLFLTPYIQAGKIGDARRAATVEPLLEGIVSYSGYFTVDEKYDSNLFFWFFPSETSWTSKPVILWLQGGPGSSSLVGELVEHGPIKLTASGLQKNPFSWSLSHNIIYLDNPVGTGFSFTNSTEGLLRTEKEVGEAVYKALIQFFDLFPELKTNSFYLSGVSYAGKYVPSVGMAIHEHNRASPPFAINLQGLSVGNGLVDPLNMLHYGDYCYQLGLVDLAGKAQIERLEEAVKHYIEAEEWTKATEAFGMLIMDHYYPPGSLYSNLTGITQHYNYVVDKDTDNIQTFVKNETIKRILHLGSNAFHTRDAVGEALKEEITKSAKPVLETLLDHYDVLLYNGQFDIICAHVLLENSIDSFQWSGEKEFKQAQRSIWKVDGKIAGYRKKGGRLTLTMVRNSGHFVPKDQPVWALDLITKFTSGYSL